MRQLRHRRFGVVAGLCTLSSVGALSAQATTIYVNGTCGNDAWSGTNSVCQSPNGPKHTIQAAINAAAVLDVVEIANGTYSGTGNNNIQFTKRITVRSANGPNSCTIGRVIFSGSTTVLESRLEGVTIELHADGPPGGAIRLNSAGTIGNCHVANNYASQGGGIYCAPGITARIVDCLLDGNEASGGGGVYCGYASTVELRNCVVNGNTADGVGGGGGIGCNYGSQVNIIDCSITNNVISDFPGGEAPAGGGVGSWGATVKIVNCSITGNFVTFSGTGPGGGAGVAVTAFFDTIGHLIMVNSLIANNETGPAIDLDLAYSGAGLHNFGSIVEVTNCTFYKNRSGLGGGYTEDEYSLAGTQASTFHNCVFWANEPEQFYLNDSDNTVEIKNSDVQGGLSAVGGAIEPTWSSSFDQDPLFVDATNGDLQLQYFSPCLNNGDASLLPADEFDLDGDSNTTESIPFDLDSHARQINPTSCVDIGAYENTVAGTCTGDITGGTGGVPDSTINVADLLRVINTWGTPGGASDFAPSPCGNANVNTSELLIVISNWGDCVTGAGDYPATISECFSSFCAGLEGAEWQDCINKCIEAVCEANPSECD